MSEETAILRQLLCDAAYLFYTQRQRCSDWGKIRRSCPNCMRLGEMENRLSAEVRRLDEETKRRCP